MMSEDKIQELCIRWFNIQYPNLARVLCYNLNNPRSKVSGARDKRMGLQKGRSDLVLYLNSTAYMIEMKTEKGKQSPSQKEWQKEIEAQGFRYYIVRSVDQFIDTIHEIISDADLKEMLKNPPF